MQTLIQNMPKSKALVSVFIFSVLVIAAYSLYSTGFITLGKGNYITVTGSSTSNQPNQVATFTATVTVNNAEKSKAVSQMNEKSKNIVDSVKNFGIEAKDIKTTNLNIYQQQNWNQTDQKYTYGDWAASVSVDVTLRDVSKATDLSALLSGLDTSYLYGPNFRLDDTQNNETVLLQDALMDARKKADAIARASGKSLGEMTMFTEGYNYGITPIMYDKMGYGMGGGGGAAPIEPGTSTSSKTVTVTYRLR